MLFNLMWIMTEGIIIVLFFCFVLSNISLISLRPRLLSQPLNYEKTAGL